MVPIIQKVPAPQFIRGAPTSRSWSRTPSSTVARYTRVAAAPNLPRKRRYSALSVEMAGWRCRRILPGVPLTVLTNGRVSLRSGLYDFCGTANSLPLQPTAICSEPDVHEGQTGWVLPIRNPEKFMERLFGWDTDFESLCAVTTVA